MSAADERRRLEEDASRERHWKRFGPYLSDRQWATVREDYSQDGDCWSYFPHDHARSRAYRWGEDGLLGISDHLARLCNGHGERFLAQHGLVPACGGKHGCMMQGVR